MRDTPRTEVYVLDPLPQVVSADWARQLERELNAANERIKRLEAALQTEVQAKLHAEGEVETLNERIADMECELRDVREEVMQ